MNKLSRGGIYSVPLRWLTTRFVVRRGLFVRCLFASSFFFNHECKSVRQIYFLRNYSVTRSLKNISKSFATPKSARSISRKSAATLKELLPTVRCLTVILFDPLPPINTAFDFSCTVLIKIKRRFVKNKNITCHKPILLILC